MQASKTPQLAYVRVARFRFLFYILAHITSMALGGYSQVILVFEVTLVFWLLIRGVNAGQLEKRTLTTI